MIRRLSAAGALSCALAFPVAAQVISAPAVGFVPGAAIAFGSKDGPATFVSAGSPLPTTRPSVLYSEATVTMSAGVWSLVSAANASRQKLILGDAAGLGCVWARAASAPTTTGEGVPFSGPGAPGSWVFDDPVPQGAIWGLCAGAGVITKVEG